MNERAFPDQRMAALALLNGNYRLSRKAGQFLGQLAVEATPLSQAQADWLAKLLNRAGLPPVAEARHTMSTYPDALAHRHLGTRVAPTDALLQKLVPLQPKATGGALKLHRVGGFGEVSFAAEVQSTGANLPMPHFGTPVAVSYLNVGVGAHLPRTSRIGGARNHADRQSHSLSRAQATNLIAATAHATAIGLPFTRMITIHWEAAGVPLGLMAKATGRFTDLITKALARHGSRTAWLWVHENGDQKGGHCHLLVHVPAALVPVVTRLQKGWLRRITDKPYRRRVIHSKPVGGRLGLEVGNPDLHAINLEAALFYVLKGASAAAASQLNLERLEPGGRVIGKRCGTSQNIGKTARARARRSG